MKDWLSSWRKPALILGAVAFIELGARVGVPGVDAVALMQDLNHSGGSFLLSLYTVIAGGGLFRAGVLALGIVPFLAARTYMRLWSAFSPGSAARLQGDRKKQTRWLTGILSVIQSVGFASFLQRAPGVVANPGPGFMTTAVLTLTAGSLVMMWFGEKITERDEDEYESLSALPAIVEAAKALPEPGIPAEKVLLPQRVAHYGERSDRD